MANLPRVQIRPWTHELSILYRDGTYGTVWVGGFVWMVTTTMPKKGIQLQRLNCDDDTNDDAAVAPVVVC